MRSRRLADAEGVFNNLLHRVPDSSLTVLLDGPYARQLGHDGRIVYFAVCGSACWTPTDTNRHLFKCPTCRDITRDEGWP